MRASESGLRILRQDGQILLCVKPAGVVSTDVPGGAPALAREALGDASADVRTVHRLDQVVGGLLLLARGKEAASALGHQIMEGRFEKEYLAAVHGAPPGGTLRDLLWRDRAERKSYVVTTPRKGAQEAVLDYTVLDAAAGLSLVRVVLRTGRTHQIRAQFSSHGWPLAGDRKYGTLTDDCPIGLWSYRLAFDHPATGERMDVTLPPPETEPWTAFGEQFLRTGCPG